MSQEQAWTSGTSSGEGASSGNRKKRTGKGRGNSHSEENGIRRSRKRKGQENPGEAKEGGEKSKGKGKKKERGASNFPKLEKLTLAQEDVEDMEKNRKYLSFLIQTEGPVQAEIKQLEEDPHRDQKRLEELKTMEKKINLAKNCLKVLDAIKALEEAIFLQESEYDSARDESSWIEHASSDLRAYVPACESAAVKAEAKLAKAKKDAGESPTEEQMQQIAELEVEKDKAVALANKAGKVFRDGPQMKREAEQKGLNSIKEHSALIKKRRALLAGFDELFSEEKRHFVSMKGIPGAEAAAAATGFVMASYSERAPGGESEGGGDSGGDGSSESPSDPGDSKESSKENKNKERKEKEGADDEFEWGISLGDGPRRAGRIGWDTAKMFGGTLKRASSEIIGFVVGFGGALVKSLLSYANNPKKVFGGWKHWGDGDKKK